MVLEPAAGLALLLLVVCLVVALRGNGAKQLASAAVVGDSAAKPLELNPVNESQFVVVDAPVNLDEFPLETQSALPARLRRDVGKTSIGTPATDAAATDAPPAEPSTPASSELSGTYRSILPPRRLSQSPRI